MKRKKQETEKLRKQKTTKTEIENQKYLDVADAADTLYRSPLCWFARRSTLGDLFTRHSQ